MILNIILMVVVFKLLIDVFRVREGMDLELPILHMKECDYAVNLVFPYYDAKKNLYTDQNSYMYYNYKNILHYAKKPCVPKK